MRDEDLVERELDRLLNDPDVLLQPGRVWALVGRLQEEALREPLIG